MKVNLKLVGDGILNGSSWLEDPHKNLKHYLEHNNTDIEFSTDSLPDTIASENVRLNKDFKHSVKELREKKTHFTSVYNKDNSLIVLSVGGNDLKHHSLKLAFGETHFMTQVLTDSYKKDFSEAIKILKGISKVIIVSNYLPYLGKEGTYYKYKDKSIKVITKWSEFIYSVAKINDIPIIDLNKTVNCENRKNYAKDDTKINSHVFECLSRCIKHAYINYNSSLVYYAPNCGDIISHKY